jgi:hypothetical protein
MKEYTATTLERARHVLRKFPLSDGAKMAIGKDLEYGYTWAALPENKRALVATMPPIKPGVFTVFTTEGHTLNLTGNALTQMITNARTRHRNTKARIRAYRTRENNPTRFAGRKGVDYTASAEREQRDYEAGIRNTFRIAGWGEMEFTTLDESDNGVDRTRGEVAETPEHPAPARRYETPGPAPLKLSHAVNQRLTDVGLKYNHNKKLWCGWQTDEMVIVANELLSVQGRLI